jgi:solute carrier family 25 ornithine transporter 2/15
MSDILRAEGVAGLFRGLTATFTREMPGYFFFFFAYELTRDLLRSGPNQTKDDIGRASHENSSSRFVSG